MFKKAVMLPTYAETPNGTKHTKNFDMRVIQQPFMRGIMEFDDYSYSAFNKYVLTTAPTNQSQAIDELEGRLSTVKGKAVDASSKLSEAELSAIEQKKSFKKEALTIEVEPTPPESPRKTKDSHHSEDSESQTSKPPE